MENAPRRPAGAPSDAPHAPVPRVVDTREPVETPPSAGSAPVVEGVVLDATPSGHADPGDGTVIHRRTEEQHEITANLTAILSSIVAGGKPFGDLVIPRPPKVEKGKGGARTPAVAPAPDPTPVQPGIADVRRPAPEALPQVGWPAGPNLGDDMLRPDELEAIVCAIVTDPLIMRAEGGGLSLMRLCVAAHRAGFDPGRIARFGPRLLVWFGDTGASAPRPGVQTQWGLPRVVVADNPDLLRRLLRRKAPPSAAQVEAARREGLDAVLQC